MDDFQIISKLGEGAYSTVFKVMRTVDGKTYALKKVKLLNLSDKEKENALNEVRILASVKSNYVVSYKEAFFDEKDRTLCIVMEFADNGDLYQKIVEHKKKAMFFEESEIWRIFIQLVKGLKALHDLKILHRDLKSANVFLYTNGDAKIGDLNVSKVTRAGVGHTQTGTPYYASPEVWNDKPYDNKSDIWSLGCVLYEMITLKPPFRAQDMEGLYKRVIKGQYNRIPDRFSSDLFQIIQFLLQVNPKLRPSCEQILNHPIVQKRIEYFKSISGDRENQNNLGNNKSLLKTIHMPKNLLFLSDKLPKPNYDKHIKNNEGSEINVQSYRSYQNEQKEIEEIPKNNQYNSIQNLEKNSGYNNEMKINNSSSSNIKSDDKNNNIINNRKIGLILNNNKIVIMPPIAGKYLNPHHHKYLINHNNLPNIGSSEKLFINKNKKNMQKELVSLNIIAKQKNELSKLMLNNNSLNRKLNYLNNNGYLNPSHMKDIYKIYPYINRPLPQKGLNSGKMRPKYLSPNYYRNERYYGSNSQKKVDYDYNIKNNNLIIKNNINVVKKEGPEFKVVPKKKLSPIKKSN